LAVSSLVSENALTADFRSGNLLYDHAVRVLPHELPLAMQVAIPILANGCKNDQPDALIPRSA
jgi:hypothetical protein